MSAAEAIDPRMTAWVQSIQTGDPLLFATGVLGFAMPGKGAELELEVWQVTALKKYRKAWRNRFDVRGRLSIRAGHSVGKTAFLTIVILFSLFAGGPDTKIPVVSSSENQLRDGMWPEIAKWIRRLPDALRDEIRWESEKVFIKAAPEECFSVRRTASKHNPEALQGIHAKTVLAIFEEASGIPEETIEASVGTLATPGAMAIAVGNPTRRSGFFWKTHNDPKVRAGWDTMVVNSEDVPRAQGHIQDTINLYGKDSNKYRVRVLGEFPTKDDDTVIALSLVEAAKNRKVDILPVWPVWGVDVARFGDDRSTLLRRQGNALLRAPNVWRNMDGKQVADKIIGEYMREPNDMKPRAIAVDVLNMGASVVDHLTYSPELSADDVTIIAVNVAEGAARDEIYHRLRDELWFRAKEWFSALNVTIPCDLPMSAEEIALTEMLIAELATPTYDIARSGKTHVCPKDIMKKDLGYSPDLADGFINTFACPVFPRVTKRADRWAREDSRSDPWAA